MNSNKNNKNYYRISKIAITKGAETLVAIYILHKIF